MKILYGVQGTGNGHIRRAREIIEALQKYGEVDVLLSGTQSELILPYSVKYKKYGLFFISGQQGGPNILGTLQRLQLRNLAYDIYSLPVTEYDLIVSDYEPITAWASYFKKVFSVGLSNQVSFFSPHTPRPQRKNINIVIEYLLKHFIPCSYNIGFHYQPYDNFIETPVIPQELRNATITDEGHIVVYLPAYHPRKLIDVFLQIPEIEWHIFCKQAHEKHREKNIVIQPIGPNYSHALLSAHGLISAAGFQATAEAIFLGKKLLVIPHRWHYEQECNAAALRTLGISILEKIDNNFVPHVRNWLYKASIIKINYPNNTSSIVGKILRVYYDNA